LEWLPKQFLFQGVFCPQQVFATQPKCVLHQGWQLFCTLTLQAESDPDPAFASKKQAQKDLEREFTAKSYSFIT